MITSIELSNFKCFASVRLELAPLTLLTGYNGGGKSTAVQSLLILAQRTTVAHGGSTYPLNGSLVRLGTVGDVIAAGTDSSSIEFTVGIDGSEVSFVFQPQAGERFLRLANTSEPLERERYQAVSRALSDLVYVSASRGSISDAFPIPDTGRANPRDVGVDGRFAPYVYDTCIDEEVPASRLHPREEAPILRKQLDAWMGELFPGAQASVQFVSQLQLLGLQLRVSDIGEWQRPTNIGFGLSYAFPVLVALLTAQPGQLVVIDSPEAHLHPSAQSAMGRILARFAAAGVQVIVETHSDHLLNGARIAIKRGEVSSQLVRIHFFSGATSESHGVVSPRLDQEGAIYDWPPGFFDQSEKDLTSLAGLD